MGRHVVGAFGVMYPAGVLRRQGLQRGAQIGLHVGVSWITSDAEVWRM
jgi:hypothetical protein